MWQIPFTFENGFLNQVLGGWTMAGTLSTRSGLPFTVIDTNVPAMMGNFGTAGVMPVQVNNYQQGACSNPNDTCLDMANFTPFTGTGAFPNEVRNQFRGPGYFDTDLSVTKTFKLGERLRFGVGANAFNLFNHPNFANPTYDIADPTNFGHILSTVSPPTSPYGAFVGAAASARIIQLQAKFNF